MAYDITILNNLSRTLCETVNEVQRRDAEETLSKLIESADCLQNCLLMLESGEQPYAQVVASGALKRLLHKKIGLNVPQRLELSRYLLKYLVDRPNLPLFIVNPLCKLFALLTKVGWLEKDPQTDIFHFQVPVQQILLLAKQNQSTEGVLSLKLLNALVEEVNSDEGMESVSKLRKTSADFRDNRLLDIFILTLDILKEICDSKKVFSANQQLPYVSQTLDLAFACTSYDFIGSLNDETLDENNYIQVPTKWRPVLLEKQVVKLFFDLYFLLPREQITKLFNILVQLTSVRKMLFDTQDRQKYLKQIVSGLKRILDLPEKLTLPDNFHHFCRILSRLKANHQISELIKCEDFSALLQQLTNFTMQSLSVCHLFTQSSIFYLLSFWSRMAGSLTYARVDVEQVNACIPKVCSAFIQSRIILCEMVVRGNADDPLEDMGAVKQMMEQFTVISRKDYKQTVEDLVQQFEISLGVLFSQEATEQQQLIARKQLIWLITMMAAGINGKNSSSNDQDEEVFDGEVISRVWKTMQMTDQRLESQQPGAMDIQLEFAYIYLMEEFRKAFISDQVQRESRVYERLASMGINDEAGVLKLYAEKIITNLKYWGKNEKILHSTLALLNDLTVGYANVRRLLKTEEIQLLLKNHCDFGFVQENADITIMRSRTSFYSSLMRLLNIELDEDISIFEVFMAPITEKFKGIYSYFQTGSINATNEAQLRMAVIGLMRDLRGIAIVCTKKQHYQLILNWCLPNVFIIMEESMKLWPGVADLTTPIFKLISELTFNRQSRLTYDMHSCMSVILFRQISKVICEYGNRLLALPPVPKDQHYKQRVKNTGVICQILRNVLSGNYVPYGVFYLYGDTCLSDALDVTFKLFLRLQEENFLVYTKLAQSIYLWLDVMTRDTMPYVSKLDEQYFIAILRAVHRGICAVDTPIISSSCTILDQIIDYIFERITRQNDVAASLCKEPEGDAWKNALAKEQDLLYELMTSIFSQLLFEDVKCQWSMTRPMLGLVILNGSRYNVCKNEFIQQQQPAFQADLQQAFDRLMVDISNTVNQKNKDNFTQNLIVFRKEVEMILKGGSAAGQQVVASGLEQEYGDSMTD